MLYIVLNTIHDMSMTLSETSTLTLWSSNNYTINYDCGNLTFGLP